MKAASKPIAEMTDLEFVDHWIDNSEFINPILFKELRERGLYHITNYLSGDRDIRRATARARMAHAGHYVGEPEIEEIAGHVDRIKKLRNDIFNTDATEPVAMLKLVDDMKVHLEFVRDYFKPTKVA